MANKTKAGPTYSDSILLDRLKYDDTPQVTKLRDRLFSSLQAEFPDMRYVSDHRETLTLVLINLLYAELLESTPYVAYSRDNNRFGPGTRYKAINIQRMPLQRATRWLAQNRFVEEKLGYSFEDTGESYVTRMRATTKLKKLFEEHKWDASIFQPDPPKNPIVLRDSNGCDLPLPETPAVSLMKEAVHKVNEFLSTVRIEIDGQLRPIGYYRRIFNKESFDFGGRWYGHWIQNEKNNLKKVEPLNTRERRIADGRLTLNSEPTVELDYHAMHLTMLYHKNRLQPDFVDANDKCDGYGLADFGFGKEYRPLIKKICMCCINNPSRRSAAAAIRSMLYDEELREFQGVDIGHIMSAFEEAHSPVREQFFQEWGLRLQRTDSDIVEKVMLHFVGRRIPCLSLHDSFIVPRQHKRALIAVMTSAWQDVVGFGAPLLSK